MLLPLVLLLWNPGVVCCGVTCCALQSMAERFSTDIAGACASISSMPEAERPKVRNRLGRVANSALRTNHKVCDVPIPILEGEESCAC